MDPPYGVKYGSNFQPFVRKREVKHGQDDDMIREPEMVKAYRDTWELGLHSYLTYLRDRLLLARELLKENGSIFVQISDEKLHHVRTVMDEVFGTNNFVLTIVVKKKSATMTTHPVNDYLLWFAKDKDRLKPVQLYYRRSEPEDDPKFNTLIAPDGLMVNAGGLSRRNIDDKIAEGWRWARVNYPLVSQHYSSTRTVPYVWKGKSYTCGANNQWRYDVPRAMDRLALSNRLYDGGGKSLGGIVYWDDWPYVGYNNIWSDLHGEPSPIYVVQTSYKIVERCLFMATEPGDLVFDPTCGSGTTAYVAEHWGRRWITCDTSRVPLALTRQRLLTATFPWYQLKEPVRGPAGGFVYERRCNRKGEEVGGLVPRITLKSIANDEEPETVTLVDRPEVNAKITRVCGRFTVEATVQAARTVDDPPPAEGEPPAWARTAEGTGAYENPRRYLDRMIEVLRQSHTLQLPGNTSLHLAQVRPLSGADHDYLHAEAEETAGGAEGKTKRIAVVFGPEHGAIDSQGVVEAAREAYFLKYDALYLFGFAIQAKARELVADRRKLRLPCVYVSVTPDVVMSDLLKTSQASQVFAVTGLPDVRLERLERRGTDGGPLYQLSLLGLDIFRPQDLETEAIPAQQLPCWMLDSDYNGLVFMARQVFFPRTSAWENLEKSLRGRFAEGVWAHLAGTVSEPFAAGPQRQIAVKVIDERGHELMVVKSLAL